MKEPMSFRISDSRDPKRGKKFEDVLELKKANATDVLRALTEAYIETGGRIDFPVKLVSARPTVKGR